MIKTIIEAGYEQYLEKVAALEEKGYSIEDGHPPMLGFSYHAVMFKPDKIPMTRAEVLAVARAAKAEKKLEGDTNEQEETEE